MGRKDPEQEVEKFVTSNTQELGKDKWLCPLSGKKFKVCDYRVVLLGYREERVEPGSLKPGEEVLTGIGEGGLSLKLRSGQRGSPHFSLIPSSFHPGPRVCT